MANTAMPFAAAAPAVHPLSADTTWFEPVLREWTKSLSAQPPPRRQSDKRALVGMLSRAAWHAGVPNMTDRGSRLPPDSWFVDMYAMAADESNHLFFAASAAHAIVAGSSPLLTGSTLCELDAAEVTLRRWSTEVEHIAEVRAANPHQRFTLLALLFVAPQLRDPAAAKSLHWPSTELPGRPEFSGWRVEMEAWAPTSVDGRWPYDPERETHWPGVFLLALGRSDL